MHCTIAYLKLIATTLVCRGLILRFTLPTQKSAPPGGHFSWCHQRRVVLKVVGSIWSLPRSARSCHWRLLHWLLATITLKFRNKRIFQVSPLQTCETFVACDGSSRFTCRTLFSVIVWATSSFLMITSFFKIFIAYSWQVTESTIYIISEKVFLVSMINEILTKSSPLNKKAYLAYSVLFRYGAKVNILKIDW